LLFQLNSFINNNRPLLFRLCVQLAGDSVAHVEHLPRNTKYIPVQGLKEKDKYD
jgi:hypothetical protein